MLTGCGWVVVTLTLMLPEAGTLLATVLVDTVQLVTVGDPVTTGFTVSRPVTDVGAPVPGLVQTTVLQGAVESMTTDVFSVKVPASTPLVAGMGVRVVSCTREPALVGKVLLVDKVSFNGLALIRKGVATMFEPVNQEGKGTL